MVIEQAQLDDIAGIIELFEEAAVWLESKNLFQWPIRVAPRFWSFLREKVRDGEVFVVRGGNGRLLAHIRFDYHPNKVWCDNPANTAYVRGLVIANEVRGQGMGTALLDWAQGYVRQRGFARLRLDCLAENGRLRQYYRDYGFTYVGQSHSGNYKAALFEMRV